MLLTYSQLPAPSPQPWKPLCCPTCPVLLVCVSMTSQVRLSSQSHYALMSTAVLPSVLLEVVFKCFCGGKIWWWRDRGWGAGRRKRVRSPLGNLQSWVETGAEECRQSILAFSSFLSLRSSGGIQMVSTDGCWHHFNANENPQFGVW